MTLHSDLAILRFAEWALHDPESLYQKGHVFGWVELVLLGAGVHDLGLLYGQSHAFRVVRQLSWRLKR